MSYNPPFIITTPPGLESLLGIYTYGDIPGMTKIVFNAATCIGGFDIDPSSTITEIDFPNLVSTDPAQTQNQTGGGGFVISTNAALTVLNLPRLAVVGGNFYCQNNPVLNGLALPLVTTIGGGFDCGSNATMTSIVVPVLATIGATLSCYSNPALTGLSVPALSSIGASINIDGNNILTNVSLPLLVSVAGSCWVANCSALTTVNLSSWLPTDGSTNNFATNALSEASVDNILARCVANAAFVSGSVDLSGGTNAAPGTQGAADKDTLTGRGVTVTTN